jgi:hypothetical protein
VYVTLRSVLASVGLVAAAGLAAPAADAANGVGVVVLKEHATGTTSQAQPYLDQLMAITAQHNGWAAASGKFFTKRPDAEAWIKSDGPHFGILSLAPFLALRQQHNLEIIGQAHVKGGGGGLQYFIVSKTAGSLADCKGKKLATDWADDQRFAEKIIAGGAWTLADFTVEKTTRPAQAGSKLANNEVECALIDDAQLPGAQKADPAIKPVWTSAKLPPMVVVAFPAAPAAEKTSFQNNLPKICQGSGQPLCDSVGLASLNASDSTPYAALIKAY